MAFSFNSAATTTAAPPAAPSGLFGAKPPTAPGGLFGATPAAANNTSGLFGSAQPANAALANPSSSLFTSVTTSNGPSLFGSNTAPSNASNTTASFFSNSTNVNNNNINNSSNNDNNNSNNTALNQNARSPVDMGNLDSYSAYSSRRATPAPAWAPVEVVKHIPSHLSIMRHDSSFNNPDRPACSSGSSFRRSTISSSPSNQTSAPNSFGSSFGTPRPAAFKKKTNIIGDEDLPPTQSIYDSGSSSSTLIPTSVSRRIASGDQSSYRVSGANSPAVPALSFSSSGTRSVSGSSSGTTGSSIYSTDSNSVIIFGFPPSLIPAVVSHFSRFGNILENIASSSLNSNSTASGFRSGAKSVSSLRPIQSGKNWLKITYDNPASAARALSENGTIFANNYAIGCISCTPQNLKEFSDASAKNMNDQLSSRPETPVSLIDLNTPISSTTSLTTPAADSKVSLSSLSSLPSSSSSIYPKLGVSDSVPSLSTDHVARPLLAGAKRLEIQDGQSIFKERERSSKLWGVVGMGASTRAPTGANVHGTGLTLNAKRDSWLGWAVKKTQEMVFGWEDL